MLSANEPFLNGQIPTDKALHAPTKAAAAGLSTDTRSLQLGMSEVAREVGSLDQLRGPPATPLSPTFFSITVTRDEEEEHVMKGLGLPIGIFGLGLGLGY